ncbi:MAG: WcaF family extracellular polysaccharide biosynthesis acetyltransferase [Thermoanaerobaculia bacterium]
MTTHDDAVRRIVSPVPMSEKLKRAVWALVQSTLFRCSLHTANRWRAFLLRRFGATVGHHCTIRRTSTVYYPWKLTLGSVSSLGDGATVYNLGAITIGDRVTVSQEAYLCAGTHDYRTAAMPLVTPPIAIGDDAWICARAFVGPGVTVGEGTILAACAVAFRDLDPWTIYAGNPAEKQKERPRLR